jgi:DNA-binding PadR family transcriptional regulator
MGFMERELLLLGLLRHQDMHGYQLAEFINRDLASCTDLKKSTAYFLLGKMTERGWISEEVIEQSTRPDRRVFRITAQGEAEFQRLLRENLSTYSPARFADDIGLAFLDALPPAEARDLLNQRRAALAAAQEQAQAIPAHHGSLNLVIEHQARHLAAEIDWLDEVIGRLGG